MNDHDDALDFEPIHRVLFGVDPADFLAFFRRRYPNAYEGRGAGHVIEMVWQDRELVLTVL